MRLVREVRSAADEGTSPAVASDPPAAWQSTVQILTAGRAVAPIRVGVSLAVSLAVSGVLMVTVDRPLALFFKQTWTHDELAVWRWISELGNGTPYALVAFAAIAVCAIIGMRSVQLSTLSKLAEIRRIAWLLLASLAVSGAVVQIVKFAMGRLRPRYLFENGSYGFEPFNLDFAANSFPSGHTQTICVVGLVLFLAWPRYALWVGLVAAIVSISRIVLTAHYVSDVLMGAAVGSAVVLLLAPLFLMRPKSEHLPSH